MHNGLPAGKRSPSRTRSVRRRTRRRDRLGRVESARRAGVRERDPGLPFGLDGILGPAFGGSRARSPRSASSSSRRRRRSANGNAGSRSTRGYLPLPPTRRAASGAPERARVYARALERVARFLDEARFGGSSRISLRCAPFFPTRSATPHCGALTALRDCVHDELDRLFIKLRLPNYAIAPRDIETPSLRSAIERVLHDAGVGARNARQNRPIPP